MISNKTTLFKSFAQICIPEYGKNINFNRLWPVYFDGRTLKYMYQKGRIQKDDSIFFEEILYLGNITASTNLSIYKLQKKCDRDRKHYISIEN